MQSQYTLPDGITCLCDLQYGDDPCWNRYDIYVYGPGSPTLVSVHGGGWNSCTKEDYRDYCLSLARRGFNIANFTFRLAPQYLHPAMIEDVNTMLSHLLKHGEACGLDTRNVFFVGDSAGAHILTMYAAMCTNPDYAAKFDFKLPYGFVPSAVGLNCGVYDVFLELSKADGCGRLIADYVGAANQQARLAEINVVDYITKAFPPAFVVTSNGDALRHQWSRLLSVLSGVGAEFTAREYGGDDLLLGHDFHIFPGDPGAELCNDEECRFFRDHCGR